MLNLSTEIIRCVMALTRGVNSLFPCTQCLIPNSEQGDPSATAPLQTTAGTIAVLHEAREQHLLGEKEDILKNAGLRDVDVSFIHLSYTATNNSSVECILEDKQLRPIYSIIF